MKRLLLPLLAALALPTAVNATNYIECEAIYTVAKRQYKLWEESDFKNKDYEGAYDRALKDFKKRSCYYY